MLPASFGWVANMISKTCNIAVERLTFENPTTLAKYDALWEEPLGGRENHYRTTRIVYHPSIYINKLTLARENDLLAVLPCAYLRASRQSLNVILTGIVREDGSMATLSSTDQRICLPGRENLLQIQWKLGNTLGWLPLWDLAENGCQDYQKCTAFRNRALAQYLMAPGHLALTSSSKLENALCISCACMPRN
ncbi:hypothetical protein B0H17DRAFT_1303832 [Mycena rosella]|uniref:Uncharacterized protein n=1 Tax=Mycena rosella TaxID=1033263 RepID=A0AAD7GBF8_MYCRO|nr:hypothetical protein B0H17DRAFT_1303832 [Mycena rosella]